MAKKYVRPVLHMEEFVSNEFVSNCYYMNCSTIAGWFEDLDGDTKYDSGEMFSNGSGENQQLIHANSLPQQKTDNLYKAVGQPTNFWEWAAWVLRFIFVGNKDYDNRSQYTPINPGLYIVNDGGKTYGSTQQPTPVPGHPNRS